MNNTAKKYQKKYLKAQKEESRRFYLMLKARKKTLKYLMKYRQLINTSEDNNAQSTEKTHIK